MTYIKIVDWHSRDMNRQQPTACLISDSKITDEDCRKIEQILYDICFYNAYRHLSLEEIVDRALDKIRDELHLSFSLLQWDYQITLQ